LLMRLTHVTLSDVATPYLGMGNRCFVIAVVLPFSNRTHDVASYLASSSHRRCS
jgi:hypothetical protein